MPTYLSVVVRTLETDYQLKIKSKALASSLFEIVCNSLGIYETWYFGMYFLDFKGLVTWINLDNTVLDQVTSSNSRYELFFRVKFYPEDVAEDLIQDATKHFFFLEVSRLILSGGIYCPSEACLLLSSYAVQSKYGDYDANVYKHGFLRSEYLIPDNIQAQFQMSHDMWEDRIVAWYSQRKGLLRDEAELEYLKIAQDLEMYGVTYFEILNKRGTHLWLGVDSLGLSIYEYSNKITPKIAFPWSEVRNISFNDKKFVIKPIDRKSPDFAFYAPRVRINRQILQLCIGNHEQFLKKRNYDTMALQQIKIQAKEQRSQKQIERRLLEVENLSLGLYDSTISSFSFENTCLNGEKETTTQKRRFDKQFDKPFICNMRNTGIESGSKSNSLISGPLVEEGAFKMTGGKSQNIGTLQSSILANHLDGTRLGGYSAENLFSKPMKDEANCQSLNQSSLPCSDPEYNENLEIVRLKFEMQRDENEYIAKSAFIYSQMSLLRKQMDSLKIRDMMSITDIQHEDKICKGETKYSTIHKVQEGTTKSRIAFFEEL